LRIVRIQKLINFAQESRIEKIKVPFSSAINVLSDSVLISVSTKCGEWVVYLERVSPDDISPFPTPRLFIPSANWSISAFNINRQ